MSVIWANTGRQLVPLVNTVLFYLQELTHLPHQGAQHIYQALSIQQTPWIQASINELGYTLVTTTTPSSPPPLTAPPCSVIENTRNWLLSQVTDSPGRISRSSTIGQGPRLPASRAASKVPGASPCLWVLSSIAASGKRKKVAHGRHSPSGPGVAHSSGEEMASPTAREPERSREPRSPSKTFSPSVCSTHMVTWGVVRASLLEETLSRLVPGLSPAKLGLIAHPIITLSLIQSTQLLISCSTPGMGLGARDTVMYKPPNGQQLHGTYSFVCRKQRSTNY